MWRILILLVLVLGACSGDDGETGQSTRLGEGDDAASAVENVDVDGPTNAKALAGESEDPLETLAFAEVGAAFALDVYLEDRFNYVDPPELGAIRIQVHRFCLAPEVIDPEHGNRQVVADISTIDADTCASLVTNYNQRVPLHYPGTTWDSSVSDAYSRVRWWGSAEQFGDLALQHCWTGRPFEFTSLFANTELSESAVFELSMLAGSCSLAPEEQFIWGPENQERLERSYDETLDRWTESERECVAAMIAAEDSTSAVPAVVLDLFVLNCVPWVVIEGWGAAIEIEGAADAGPCVALVFVDTATARGVRESTWYLTDRLDPPEAVKSAIIARLESECRLDQEQWMSIGLRAPRTTTDYVKEAYCQALRMQYIENPFFSESLNDPDNYAQMLDWNAEYLAALVPPDEIAAEHALAIENERKSAAYVRSVGLGLDEVLALDEADRVDFPLEEAGWRRIQTYEQQDCLGS